MLYKAFKKLNRLIFDNIFTTFIIPNLLFLTGRPEKISKIVAGHNDFIVTNKLFFPRKKDLFINYQNPYLSVCMQGKITSFTELFCFLRALKICDAENIELVLSTWEKQILNKLIRALAVNRNVKLLFNSRPVDAGPQNVNLQMVSTSRGLGKTSSKKVLKLRTDHWISHSSLFAIFESLTQQNDIVVGASDLRSFFGYRDQYIFGSKENLTKLFSDITINTSDLTGSVEELIFSQIGNKVSFKIIDISLLPLIWCKYPNERLYGSSNNHHKLQLSLWL